MQGTVCADLLPYLRIVGALIVLGVILDVFAVLLRGAVGMALGTADLGRAGMELFGMLVGVAMLTGSVPDLLALAGWGCGPAAAAPDAASALERIGAGAIRLFAVTLMAGGALALLWGAVGLVAGTLSGGARAAAGAVRWALAGLLLMVSGALVHAAAAWALDRVRQLIARM